MGNSIVNFRIVEIFMGYKLYPLKISACVDFAHVMTSARLPAMQILVSIGIVGASPQIGETLPPCAFFECPVLYCHVLTFFLYPTTRSNR